MIDEIQDQTDAQRRLKTLYGIEGISAEPYVALLGVLCRFPRSPDFVSALEEVSAGIWKAYNKSGMETRSNRFTRAIINYATEFGFAVQDNVVLTGPLSGRSFGALLGDGVLWKDSFAVGHGEFAHSYQWLAVGKALSWGTGTAKVYKSVRGKMSKRPIFVKRDTGIEFQRSPLWEWMVDCSRHQDWFDHLGRLNEAVVRAQSGRPTGSSADAVIANLASMTPQDPTNDAKLISKSPIDDYPWANALTADAHGIGRAGSYRNANNVTDLVKRQSDWFINAYELHRQTKLETGTASAARVIKNLAEYDPNLQSGRERKDYLRHAAHPIEAGKLDRGIHYQLDKHGAGYGHDQENEPNVYRRATSAAPLSNKRQFPAKYHQCDGYMNIPKPGQLLQ